MEILHYEDGTKTMLVKVKTVCKHGYCDPHYVYPPAGVVTSTAEDMASGNCIGGKIVVVEARYQDKL